MKNIKFGPNPGVSAGVFYLDKIHFKCIILKSSVTLRVIPRRGREIIILWAIFIFYKAKKHKWHYIGSTKDLRKRFAEHNNGLVKSTKFYKPFKLIYYEAYTNYSLAKKREYELKNNNQQKEILFKRLEIL